MQNDERHMNTYDMSRTASRTTNMAVTTLLDLFAAHLDYLRLDELDPTGTNRKALATASLAVQTHTLRAVALGIDPAAIRDTLAGRR